MAGDDHKVREILGATPTPISQLSPGITDVPSCVIDGVITITWPFSASRHSIAFILAEHDFRQRRSRGQVRLEFHGAVGRAINSANVGGGDEVRLSLEGVGWEEKGVPVGITGDPLPWQLSFDQRLCLILKRFGTSSCEILDVNSQSDTQQVSSDGENSTSETSLNTMDIGDLTTTAPRTPNLSAAIKRPAAFAFGNSDEYISPAFLKRARVSYGSLFEGGFDQLERESARASKRGKKTRFSLPAAAWKYSSRSPSPSSQSSTPEDGKSPVDNYQSPTGAVAELLERPASRAHGDSRDQEIGTLTDIQHAPAALMTSTRLEASSAILPVSQDQPLLPTEPDLESPVTVRSSFADSLQANTFGGSSDEYLHVPLPPEHDSHLFDFGLADRHHSDHSTMSTQFNDTSHFASASSLAAPVVVSNVSEAHTHPFGSQGALAHQGIGEGELYGGSSAKDDTPASMFYASHRVSLPAEEHVRTPLMTAADSAAPIEILSSSPPQNPADAYLEKAADSGPSESEAALVSRQTDLDDEAPSFGSEDGSNTSVTNASKELTGGDYGMRDYDLHDDESDNGNADRDSLSSVEGTRDLGVIDNYPSIAEDDDEDVEGSPRADRDASPSHDNMTISSNEALEPELEDPEEAVFEEEDVAEESGEEASDDNVNEEGIGEFVEQRLSSDIEGEGSEAESEDADVEGNFEETDGNGERHGQSMAPIFIDLLSDSEDDQDAPRSDEDESHDLANNLANTLRSDEVEGEEVKRPVSLLPRPSPGGISEDESAGEPSSRVNGAGKQSSPHQPTIDPAMQAEILTTAATMVSSAAPARASSSTVAELDASTEGHDPDDADAPGDADEAMPPMGKDSLLPISRSGFENESTAANVDGSEVLPSQVDQSDLKGPSNIIASDVPGYPKDQQSSSAPSNVEGQWREHILIDDTKTAEIPAEALGLLHSQSPSPTALGPSSTEETLAKPLVQQSPSAEDTREDVSRQALIEQSPSPSGQLLDEMQQRDSGPGDYVTDGEKESVAVTQMGETAAGRGLRSSRSLAPKQDILITVESLRSHDHMRRSEPDSQDGVELEKASADILAPTASQPEPQTAGPPQNRPHADVGAGPQLREAKETPEQSEIQTSTRVLRRKAGKVDKSTRVPDASLEDALPQQEFGSGEVAAHTQNHDSQDVNDIVAPQAAPVSANSSTTLGSLQDMNKARPRMLKMLRISLPEYLSLKMLRNSLNRTVDVIGIAASTPRSPYRPKSGPRDYLLEIMMTDPSSAPSTVSVAQIYRPHQKSLPIVHAGDVVLLRRFQVLSMKGRGFGVRAGDQSGWAVFEKVDEEMLPQIKGPPLELSTEEITYATSLREWWASLEEDAVQRIGKATDKATRPGKGNPS